MDGPIIVEYGAADIGIAGKDVLLEQKREVIELLDLGTNGSRLAVFSLRKELPAYMITIGTGYPRIANAFFVSRGTQANVITLSGDLNNVVSFRLVDCIVDLDLQRNVDESLHELEMITYVTDRLIVNRVSYILKYPEIESVCSALSLVI
ncbi:ATP phosphoribosyltransferase [Paenibacillus allorhizosphaerae]|uniref:ATP phosphoribosyltransferase n=1 Tax=Paenibacillus allorhizosphaerae TaxID=2849866 RepID=A0ABM8VCR1_9BACL|nr:ATP phosphoribosyltransferase [Paenibacillus allorhizosphaerae]CAG7624541.1 ATP phosphoribosyltransferase [Paenibacillus allorhizosphaerae]